MIYDEQLTFDQVAAASYEVTFDEVAKHYGGPMSKHPVISIKGHPEVIWVRPDMAEQDLVVVQDIFEKDSYAVAKMPMPRPVVVDVGAHIGCFTKRLHQRNPLARIFAAATVSAVNRIPYPFSAYPAS